MKNEKKNLKTKIKEKNWRKTSKIRKKKFSFFSKIFDEKISKIDLWIKW